jgi:multidrug efflux pump subunit AcrA (membrane-fusion protein)
MAGCRRAEPQAAPRAAASPAAKFFCPMHPSYTATNPGQCPICGMNLVPAPDQSDRQPTRVGRASVSVTPEVRRMLGVRTDVIRKAHLYRQIRTLGRVTAAGRGRVPSVATEVYETDMPSLSLGMPAQLMISYLPSKAWRAHVTDISSTIDDKTRSLALRLEAEDPDNLLRSGMVAEVILKSDLGLGLMVPDTAVIFSGSRRFVFVESADGQFDPRELRLGPDVGYGFQVLNGAAEGERVVTSANFLIDSESSLRGAAALLAPGAKDGR